MKRIPISNDKHKAVFLKDRFVIDGKRYSYKEGGFSFTRLGEHADVKVNGITFRTGKAEARQIKRWANGTAKKQAVALLMVAVLVTGSVVAYSYAKEQKKEDERLKRIVGSFKCAVEVGEISAREIERQERLKKKKEELKQRRKETAKHKKLTEREKQEQTLFAEERKEEIKAERTNELNGEMTYEYQASVAKEIENSEEYKAVQGRFKWDGPVINTSNGVVQGPHGRETYYNLPMGGVINIMRGLGNNDKYWVRSDGCKMLGNYIMVAAKVDATHKRGRIIKCSRGFAIVCDTGSFLSTYPNGVDVAVDW